MPDYLYPDTRIIVFAKAPVAGQVKTRMQPFLSQEQSALLQSRLIVRSLKTACHDHLAPVELWCSPSIDHDFFKHLISENNDEHFGHPIRLKRQQGQDLGEKMKQAFQTSFKDPSCKRVILIGTDCPLLSSDTLKVAVQSLEAEEVCILGAQDGGYVLIGGTLTPPCFENVDWGSESVLSQTQHHLEQHGINYEVIGYLDDLDTKQDFLNLPPPLQKELLTPFP